MAESISEPSCVVDASYLLAYLLPDEKSKRVDDLFIAHENGEARCISTQLLAFEVSNSIKVAVRRKRISEKVAKKLLIQMFELDITPYPVDFFKMFDLAIRNELTIYDASYLWLAREKKLSLLTLDTQLQKITQA